MHTCNPGPEYLKKENYKYPAWTTHQSDHALKKKQNQIIYILKGFWKFETYHSSFEKWI